MHESSVRKKRGRHPARQVDVHFAFLLINDSQTFTSETYSIDLSIVIRGLACARKKLGWLKRMEAC